MAEDNGGPPVTCMICIMSIMTIFFFFLTILDLIKDELLIMHAYFMYMFEIAYNCKIIT